MSKTFNIASFFNSKSVFLALFYLFILYLPLPLGSHRPWFWNLSHLFIVGLLFTYGSLFWQELKDTIRLHKIPILLLATVLGWMIFQWLPLPLAILSIISPEAAEAYQATGQAFGSISLDRAATFTATLKLVSYICVFVLGITLINSPDKVQMTLLVIIMAGSYNAFYGAFEIMAGQDNSLIYGIENGHRASGTFVYHNHFANFLILCLSAGLGYFIATLTDHHYESRKAYLKSWLFAVLHSKTTVRIGLTIMVIALVMSRSRMGNTAFFISLLAVSLLYILIGRNVAKGFKVLIISMLVIDIFVVSAWFGLEKVKNRLEATSMEAESRDEVVEDGLQLLAEFPLSGSGAGSFETVFLSYQSENVNLFYNYAHNDYLQFAIEYGIPITLVLGLLLAYIGFLAIKLLRTSEDRQISGGAAATLMAITGMLIHMSVDFPLQPPATVSYFMLLLSICSSLYQHHRAKG